VGWANAKLTPSELDDRLEVLRRDTPDAIFHTQMNLLTSHDTPRLLNLVEFDKARLKMAVALQMAYPGVPMVYYGEEAGCTQANPLCESGRVTFPWENIDADIHAFFRTTIAARRNSKALSLGSVETVWIDDNSHTYGFAREHEDERVLVLFNNGDADATVMLTADGRWRDLLGQLSEMSAAAGLLRVKLPAKSAVWLAPPAHSRPSGSV
jgi:glycosidase